MHCIALEECTFTIQAKDLDQNHKYNDGSNPGFEVSIVGEEGWAGEGVKKLGWKEGMDHVG